MRIFRTVFAFIVCILFYVVYNFGLRIFFSSGSDDIVFIFLSFIAIDGLGAFIAFLLASLIVPKEIRFIITGVLLYLLYAWLIYDFVVIDKIFWAVVGSILRLSFGALGAIIAIQLTSKIGELAYSRKKITQKPNISSFLTSLAIISIPVTYIVVFLSFFITLGISGWLLLIIMQLPSIPIFIIIAIGIAPLISLITALKGFAVIFKQTMQFIPAYFIKPDLYPKICNLVSVVCEKLNTQMPDHIILHAEPVFFVTQEKVLLFNNKILKGRILAIGAPLLYHLEVEELMGILAHEFAHFTGKDTAYSRKVLPVYKTIIQVLTELNKTFTGSATAFLLNILLMVPRACIITFIQYFDSINKFLSRSRELRADWIAAESFGSNNFKSALVKVVKISKYCYKDMATIKSEGNIFENINQNLAENQKKLNEIEEQSLSEKEKIFDSHPSLSTRLESVPDTFHYTDLHLNISDIINELSSLVESLSDSYKARLAIGSQSKEFGQRSL